MKPNIVVAVSLLSILFLFDSMTAAQTVVNYTGRGSYKDTGEHNPTTLNYIAGDVPERCASGTCNFEYRDFFVFDLSSVATPIASAQLALTVPLQGFRSDDADPSETFELHDVVTPISTLLSGADSLSAFSDLGGGVAYGNRVMTAADEGTVVTISLNSAAVNSLNASHGLFGFGGSIVTLDNVPNSEWTFGVTGPGAIAELRLTFIPEPSSDVLFACASLIFGTRRSRMRFL